MLYFLQCVFNQYCSRFCLVSLFCLIASGLEYQLHKGAFILERSAIASNLLTCFQFVYLYYSDSSSNKDQRKNRFHSNINEPWGPVYTWHQRQCCGNSVMTLTILFPLKSMEMLENGLQPHSGASSQSWCLLQENKVEIVHFILSYVAMTVAHSGCKWTLTPSGSFYAAMTPVILLSLKPMESLQNGLQRYSGVTPFFSMRAVLLELSQHWHRSSV